MTCYNAPRTNKIHFLDNLDSCSESLPDIIGIVFCGDLNSNTLDDNLNSRKYLNSKVSNGYEFLFNQPTRVTTESSTRMDHYITKNIMITRLYVMEAENLTDHYPIYLGFSHASNGQACEKVFHDTSFVRNPKLVKNYLEELGHKLYEVGSHDMKDINSWFEVFQEVIVRTTDAFPPVKSVHEPRKEKPKWFSKVLRTKRNRLHINGAKTNLTIKNELSSASVVWSLKNIMQLLKKVLILTSSPNVSEIQGALISY